MIQKTFANKVKEIVEKDDRFVGLAAGGSWISGQLDEFSDLDLVLVPAQKIAPNKTIMMSIAETFGDLLSGFTGEHVGEPRLLICLYDNPLLHVDLKFVTTEEFKVRVDTPIILLDKQDILKRALENSVAHFPQPDFVWIEERFWTWVHYALLKIGRGELFEALDFLGFMRIVVIGPLLHLKNGKLPRGVRKVEMELPSEDFVILKNTIPTYTKKDILSSLRVLVSIYKDLRLHLFDASVPVNSRVELVVMEYFDAIEQN